MMKKSIGLFFLFPLWLNAAVTYTEFYCNSTGTNINAGSTTNAAAAYTSVNGNWNGTDSFIPTDGSNPSGTVSAGDWGSIYVDGSTNTGYIARVLVVTNAVNGGILFSTVAKGGTLPTSSATGRSCKVGGAWFGPRLSDGTPLSNIAMGSMTNSSGNVARINMKAEVTNSITATITMNSNGPVVIQGYTNTIGDRGRWVLDGGSGSGYVMINVGPSSSCKNFQIMDVVFQNNGSSGSSDCISIPSAFGSEWSFERCQWNSIRGSGITMLTVNYLFDCEAFNCNLNNSTGKGAFQLSSSGCMAHNCIAHHNTNSQAAGFQLDGGITLVGCISATNGIGIRTSADVSQNFIQCSLFQNNGPGIELAGSVGPLTDPMVVNIINCAVLCNKAGGIVMTNSASTGRYLVGRILNCGMGTGTMTNSGGNFVTAAGASKLGTSFEGLNISGNFEFAADVTPWVAPLTGDFRVNLSTSKNAGYGYYLQAFTNGTWTGTVGYPDVGAAQHLDSGGSGGSYIFAQ